MAAQGVRFGRVNGQERGHALPQGIGNVKFLNGFHEANLKPIWIGPKHVDGPWLTVRGGYRQWYASAPFGTPDQFSAYLLSVSMSVPDITRKR